jgi:1,4-alpha-glucan branching enzyme
MPTKSFGADGTCRVEFRLPPESGHREAWVVGDFNDWQVDATPMVPGEDGALAVTVELRPGRSYRFRYYLGGDRWENDWAADAYVENEFGGADSVVTVPSAGGAGDDALT